ncbi:hypothetical protein OHR86_27970 [Streptomyces sp. NBC_00441]|uniref:zinc finger domain-containing protein n=1 Tax=Streptomyces sp. NBC_00441 TaxID=2975742 RepID=UPI002E2CC340|nr:hypothetical protein [Streptomyces sp. NBC_00441]
MSADPDIDLTPAEQALADINAVWATWTSGRIDTDDAMAAIRDHLATARGSRPDRGAEESGDFYAVEAAALYAVLVAAVVPTRRHPPTRRPRLQETRFPALAVPCPACGSAPGQLCTSHSGTRPRRHDAHQTRTAAWRAAQQTRSTQ